MNATLFRTWFQKKVVVIEDFALDHVSLNPGGIGIGGSVIKTSETWVDRPWWGRFKAFWAGKRG